MPPSLDAFDHVHVYVHDRAEAERWYARVMGLSRTPELTFWAADGGPLTLQNESGSIHIALFERPPAKPCRSTIALRVPGSAFGAWQAHLQRELPGDVSVEDHQASVSLYFTDPDGNPYEITTYEVAEAKASLERA
jgi:catechol-2,3-dioxygenase